MLELQNLHIQQGDFALTADLAIPGPGITAVVGPSGAGKSTLLNTIAGFAVLEHGQIRWKGKRFDPLPPAKRPVSMLFQDGNLFPHMTAVQNVALALTPRRRLSAVQLDRVHEVLDRVGLKGLGDKRPQALSGGQQSRVALARVLLMARPVLLLDEPFSALGPALKTEMLQLVSELAGTERLTVLMITHDPDDARQAAQLTILVADGKASAPVATQELFANPPEALKSYLG